MIERDSHHDRSLPTFITLVVAAFLLMTFDIRMADSSAVSGIRSAALTLIAPLQRVASFVVDPISDLGESLAGLASLRAENVALRAEVARLQAEAAGFQDAEARVQVLEQVLALEILPQDVPQTPANVVGRPDTFGSSLIIDKGSNDGVAVGHPVLDPFGYVVGKVISVTPSYATVVPITSDREAVTVLVDGQVGSLTSHVGSDVLTLEVFDAIEPVQAGDLVVTSAVSVSFPQGLPVGEVIEDVALQGTALSADVRPFATPDTLRVVIVITWPPEPGASTATTVPVGQGQPASGSNGQTTTTTRG
jgi:rod shape-determining protein MreC